MVLGDGRRTATCGFGLGRRKAIFCLHSNQLTTDAGRSRDSLRQSELYGGRAWLNPLPSGRCAADFADHLIYEIDI